MKYKILFFSILLLLLSSFTLAEEDNEWTLFGVQAEELLDLGSGILATILFVVTVVAFKRTKQKRLLYVSIAFALFAIKGFLSSTELFTGDIFWIGSLSSVLDFVILATFFIGMIKK